MKALWDEFGQFWLAVVGAIAAQWLLTEENLTWKKNLSAVVCGVMCAWFATWPIVEQYNLSESNVPLVAGLLALTGRQLMAIAIKRIPEIFNLVLGGLAEKAKWAVGAVLEKAVADKTGRTPPSQNGGTDENQP